MKTNPFPKEVNELNSEIFKVFGELLHYIETPGDFTKQERLELIQDAGDLIERADKINLSQYTF